MEYHNPVLLKETVDGLNIKPGGVYVDVTFGGGGHSAEILRRLGPDGTLFAFVNMKLPLQKHFGCSDMIIVLAVSAPCGIYLLVGMFNFVFLRKLKQLFFFCKGPIVSVLSKRYSFRLTIIIGSIGSAACTFILTMSRNLMEFIIIHGIIGSVFFCMVYLSFVELFKKECIHNFLFFSINLDQ